MPAHTRFSPSRSFFLFPFSFFLLIGYGSPLRGDDAVGALLAERLAERPRRGRRVIVAHQLLPEHAADLAQAHVVIFADADVHTRTPRLVRLRAGGAGGRGPLTFRASRCAVSRFAPSRSAFFAPFRVFRDPNPHHLTPESLLALAHSLYGRAPRAYLLRLPARRFDLGAPLTPAARRGLRRALRLLGLATLRGLTQPAHLRWACAPAAARHGRCGASFRRLRRQNDAQNRPPRHISRFAFRVFRPLSRFS